MNFFCSVRENTYLVFSKGCEEYAAAQPMCGENTDCTYILSYYDNGCPESYSCGCEYNGVCQPCIETPLPTNTPTYSYLSMLDLF